MFRIFSQLIFVVSIILGELTLADDASKDSEEVIVKGIGETKSEAISDAQRQALIQVVGKYVVSRDILKNRKQLSENIYSYSNGFISDFEILDMQDQNGLVEIEARSVVSRTKLFKVFEGLNINRLSLDGSAADLASSSANQSRDFANLMRDQFFGALAERNIFDIEIIEMEIVDTFPKDYKIYLDDDGLLEAQTVEVGDYFFDSNCRQTNDCEQYFKKGLMTGILISLETQLKPDFISKVEQLLRSVSIKVEDKPYKCDDYCTFGRGSRERLGSNASEMSGIMINRNLNVSTFDKGVNFILSEKNEMIFDGLTSEFASYSFWIELKLKDFRQKPLTVISFDLNDLHFRWKEIMDLSFKDDLAENYGNIGILAYSPQFKIKKVANKLKSTALLKAFGIGINTNNYSLIDPNTTEIKIPLMVTEEIAGNLSEIEVEILWKRR